MFDRILVFLLIICAIIFLWLTFNEKSNNNTFSITEMNNTNNITTDTASSYDSELEEALKWWKQIGITQYDSINQFRPGDSITRAEYAKMISTFLTRNQPSSITQTKAECLFHDFAEAGELDFYVYEACAHGLMRGSDQRFYPQSTLSRAEAITAISRYYAGNMSQNVEPRFANYVNYAVQQWFIDNNNFDAMKQKMARFEALMLLRRASKK